MIKTTIITSQLLLLFFFNSFSQTDTTVCIDFNTDSNQKLRKNIISIDAFAGGNIDVHFGIGYERILKENKTFSVSFGGMFYDNSYGYKESYHGKLSYRIYFSNVKYAKTKINNDTYSIHKQDKLMLIPKGLYVGGIAHFGIYNSGYNDNNDVEIYNSKGYGIGLGLSLGYQFIILNRIAFNVSLPVTFGYYNYEHNYYSEEETYKGDYFNPKIYLNLNLGIAF